MIFSALNKNRFAAIQVKIALFLQPLIEPNEDNANIVAFAIIYGKNNQNCGIILNMFPNIKVYPVEIMNKRRHPRHEQFSKLVAKLEHVKLYKSSLRLSRTSLTSF